MKKCLLLSIIVGLFLLIPNVKAASESELLTALTKTYTINGKKVSAPSQQKALAKKYLNQYEVSSEDADFIISQINKAVDIAEKGNATSIRELTRSEKDQIIELVEQINSKTSVKCTVSNGELIVYNPDGTVFGRASEVVKQTDGDDGVVLFCGLISFAGLAIVAKRFTKVNA